VGTAANDHAVVARLRRAARLVRIDAPSDALSRDEVRETLHHDQASSADALSRAGDAELGHHE
jgi:hypothetical protein